MNAFSNFKYLPKNKIKLALLQMRYWALYETIVMLGGQLNKIKVIENISS